MITKQDLIEGNIIGYFQLPSTSLAEANPEAYNNAIRSLPAGAGCCQYCGRPIVHHIVVQLASRRKVFIGTDCAEKVGHSPEDIRRVITAEERAAAKARAASTDWEVFQFGKYRGQRVEDVFGTDKNYVVWVADTDGGEHSNGAVARRLLQPERDAAATATAKRVEDAAELIALVSGRVVTQTHATTSWGGFVALPEPVTKAAYWCEIAEADLKAGRPLNEQVVAGAIREILKAEGFTRRGKKNAEKYDAEDVRLYGLFFPFQK